MIGKTVIQALKALLELAQHPGGWRSVSDLASAQSLPAPHLEQLLLRLRRAGLLEARRGRQGGYRLSRPPAQVSLSQILEALGVWPATWATPHGLGFSDGVNSYPSLELDGATARVTALLQDRLAQAMARELDRFTLEELVFDLRSAQASLSEEGGIMLG